MESNDRPATAELSNPPLEQEPPGIPQLRRLIPTLRPQPARWPARKHPLYYGLCRGHRLAGQWQAFAHAGSGYEQHYKNPLSNLACCAGYARAVEEATQCKHVLQRAIWPGVSTPQPAHNIERGSKEWDAMMLAQRRIQLLQGPSRERRSKAKRWRWPAGGG